MADRKLTPVQERVGSPSAARFSTEYENGTVISGQYCIESRLGDGGMGTVYRCRDLVLGRIVALKFLHPHLVMTNKWLMRFQQEAKAIGRLEHPNIIKINHFAADDDCPFLVMDYIKGESLSEVLTSNGAMDSARALKILIQVADALAHAHKNNVIHRDLKPSNIVILDGTDDFVKILDFGIAKIEEATTTPNLTQTGEIFGSPAYMSPEQCIGKNVDARTDQYSLGCVLYECLTGSPPFVSTSAMELMMHHISDAPQSLRESSLGKHFSKDLEKLLQRLLAKEPSQRFESMKAAHNELSNILCGRPLDTSARSTIDIKSQKSKTGNRMGWAVAVGISAILVAAAAALVYQFAPLVLDYDRVNSQHTKDSSAASTSQTPPPTLSDIAYKEFQTEVLDFKRSHPSQLRTFGPPHTMDIDERAMNLLASSFPGLSTLDLKDCTYVTAAGIKELSRLPLKVFYFANSEPNDKTLEAISHIKTIFCLEIPGSTSYTDNGVKLLSQMPNLRNLNIGNNANLTEKSLTYLAQSKTLSSIDLTMIPLKNLGILTNPKLYQINANGTKVDDDNVIKLSKLKTLRSLCLSNTKITDACIPAICRMKSLTSLQVKGCRNLSDTSILKLQNVFGKRLVEWR
ncbi:hypothetical protein BH10CYA1_BH10CYA1_20570 [soil metagenome]